MNNLSRLYEDENRELLETISILNFSLGFDKSIASFKQSDLFEFLEKIDIFDFECHDDLGYMIDMLCDAFNHISSFLSSQIKRTHEIMSVSRAKELDSKSIEWITKQNGITIKQKLAQGKVLGVKRYSFIDNPENRVLKIVLIRLIAISEFRIFDPNLRAKMARFVRDHLGEVNHRAQIIPNNILLYHKYYAKFYKAYQWLNHLETIMGDFQTFKKNILNTRENLKKFFALSLLHKHTNARILPSNLSINQKEYSINFENQWLKEFKIDEFLNRENDLKKFKQKCLEHIMTNKKLRSVISLSNEDIKNNDGNEVFADIFRLYPLVNIGSNLATMPLLLKQKINNQIVNANHTKIIDMNNAFYTLSQELLSKKTEVFNMFLNDIRNFIREPKTFYYVLPDYVNVFDFDDKHRSIKAYFNQAFFINKSILAAAKMLFDNKLQRDDTLLYFQKNNLGEVFVTPILVRYRDILKNSRGRGLYLEKYPSKKYKTNLQGDNKIIWKLLGKCLQNGVKALIKNDVKLYLNNRVESIPNIHEERVSNDIDRVKFLYKDSHALFKTNTWVIQDDPEENLMLFKELIEQKESGFKLWGERLPKLDIEINDGIKNKKFNLINECSELDFKNEIHIKEHFIIPAKQEEIRAPLFVEDENINYSMLLNTNGIQSEEPITCELTLKYSHENENIYTLIFKPLDEKIPQMQAKWCKGKIKQERKDMFHVYPSYPPIRSINELQHCPRKDALGDQDLFEWIERSVKKIQENLEQKDCTEAIVYRIYPEKYYFFARDNLGDEIFCHKNQLIDQMEWDNLSKNDNIFLIKHETDRGYEGRYVSKTDKRMSLKKIEQATKILYNTRFPMISIFNGHSLMDADLPNSFRTAINNFIAFMDSFKNVDKGLYNEFMFFCSTMHDCSPIGNYLGSNYAKENPKLLAYSIGNANVEWQKKILQSVMADGFKRQILVLAISLWRSESLVFDDMVCCGVKELVENSISWIDDKIPDKPFYPSKNSDKYMVKPFLVNILEVLLSLLRLRQNGIDVLNPSDKATKQLIGKLLKLSNLIVHKQALLKSYLKLELQKTRGYEEMPDLIYALISFIKGESDNSIKIVGVNDET